jgi:ribosomal protein S10
MQTDAQNQNLDDLDDDAVIEQASQLDRIEAAIKTHDRLLTIAKITHPVDLAAWKADFLREAAKKAKRQQQRPKPKATKLPRFVLYRAPHVARGRFELVTFEIQLNGRRLIVLPVWYTLDAVERFLRDADCAKQLTGFIPRQLSDPVAVQEFCEHAREAGAGFVVDGLPVASRFSNSGITNVHAFFQIEEVIEAAEAAHKAGAQESNDPIIIEPVRHAIDSFVPCAPYHVEPPEPFEPVAENDEPPVGVTNRGMPHMSRF